MRLGRRQSSIHLRLFPAHTRPLWQRLNRFLVSWLLVLLLVLGTVAGARRVLSVLRQAAERHVTALVAARLEAATTEALAAQGYAYTDLVDLEKDAAGRVQTLTVKSGAAERLVSAVQKVASAEMQTVQTRVQVPYAAFFSDAITVGAGPCISLSVAPVGACVVRLENDFSDVGDRRTAHRMHLVAEAQFALMPSVIGGVVTVQTRLPVAQMVIVGAAAESNF